MAETQDYYQGAEYRLRLCERCPSNGGGCRDHETVIPKGHLPVFKGGRPVTEPCGDRWKEYQIQKRLTQFGVPERLASSVSSQVTHTWTRQQKAHYASIIKDHMLGQFAEGPITIVPGRYASEIGVAMLREVVKGYRLLDTPRGLWARFVDVRTLLQDMKDFVTEKNVHENPMEILNRVDLLVLDNMEIAGTPEWFLNHLSTLFSLRWRHKRAMMLLSKTFHRASDEAFYLQAFGIDSLGPIALVFS